MPRLWVLNSDEAAPQDDPEYATQFLDKAISLGPRFLFCLEPGDLAVTHAEAEPAFLDYVRAVNAWPGAGELLLRPRRRSRPYSLIDSILDDPALLSRLGRLGRRGDWTLEPFLESPRVARLAKLSGIPTAGSFPSCLRSGKSLRYNDKARFKALARRLGIPTVPGLLARGPRALAKAVERLGRGGAGLILKKTLSAGGLGNRAGTTPEILRGLSGWCGAGPILVEPRLDFGHVAGVIVELSSAGAVFAGADRQVFTQGRWTGFRYPHPEQGIARLLRAPSLRLGAAYHAAGLRGELNLDWGILRAAGGRPRPYALEANFRHNGFGFILRFARRYFGKAFPGLHVLYMENVALPRPDWSFSRLRRALRGARLDGEELFIEDPGHARGAVVMMPPARGRCAVALFGPRQRWLARARAALEASF